MSKHFKKWTINLGLHSYTLQYSQGLWLDICLH